MLTPLCLSQVGNDGRGWKAWEVGTERQALRKHNVIIHFFHLLFLFFSRLNCSEVTGHFCVPPLKVDKQINACAQPQDLHFFLENDKACLFLFFFTRQFKGKTVNRWTHKRERGFSPFWPSPSKAIRQVCKTTLKSREPPFWNSQMCQSDVYATSDTWVQRSWRWLAV